MNCSHPTFNGRPCRNVINHKVGVHFTGTVSTPAHAPVSQQGTGSSAASSPATVTSGATKPQPARNWAPTITTEYNQVPAQEDEMEIKQTVPVSFIEVIRDKVDAFIRRCNKKGMPIPTLTLGEKSRKHACRPHPDQMHSAACPMSDWQEVTLTGETPRIGPWSLVASIDNVEGHPFFRPVPGADVPARFRDADPMACDYCNTNRYRTETFIVHNSDTNEYKQVGRQCIKDFLGWDVGTLVAYYESFGSMMDEPDGGFGSYIQPTFSPEEIIRYASMVVAVDGRYIKTSEDEFGGMNSTKSKVFEFLFPPFGGKDVTYYREFVEHYSNPEFKSKSERIFNLTMAGIDTLNTSSDWAYNVKTAASAKYIGIKQVGVLASATIIGLRAIDDEVKAQATGNSEFVGRVGDKVTVNVKVMGANTFMGTYGMTTLYTFITPSGDVLKWFSTGNVNIDEGDEVTLTGTVKKHEEFKGKKQTMVTRCKVER